MKKIFTFLVFIFVSSLLFACSPKDNSIELNMDNYDTYLEINARAFGSDWNTANFSSGYKTLTTTVEVSSASSNYEFIDVTIKVEITGTYWEYANGTQYIDDLHTLKLNIGGSDSSRIDNEAEENGAITDISATFNVVSITGKAKPLS